MSKENLRVALSLTEQVISLTRGNQWEKYLHGELLTVKYELQRQIGLVDADAPPSDAPEATPPKPYNPNAENTYKVEELSTVGWTQFGKGGLTKEEAQKQVTNLYDVEGYAPDRVRVVVDGQKG